MYRILYGAIVGFLLAVIVLQASRSEVHVFPVAQAGVVTDGPGIVSWDEAGLPFSLARALDEFGQVWIVGWDGINDSWRLESNLTLPVPVSEIKFWSPKGVLITKDNVLWSLGGGPGWFNRGPWPGGGVPTNESTWGSTKDKFKGE